MAVATTLAGVFGISSCMSR
nr:smalltalk protein [Bacteroides cutis]